MLAMSDAGHHHPLRRSITAQLVSNNDTRLASGCPQQPAKEPDGGKPISLRLHKNVQDDAVLINRSPEVMRDAVDLKENLVQMPFVAGPGTSSSQAIREQVAELAAPAADRFIADQHAT